LKKFQAVIQLQSLVHWEAFSSPIRLQACLVGLLLFTEEFLVFFKADWWHGSHSTLPPVLTLITATPRWSSGHPEQMKGDKQGEWWEVSEKKATPCKNLFPP
jgi:hypothetical protein